ncbi:MAG: hypothetical protein V1728_01165 [Candidatus Micrarchaeota archaeon]
METEENSLFLEFFGGSPTFRIIDFLLENRLADFTKTEISKGAGVSWAALFQHWNLLERRHIVKRTRIVGRAKLYQLDEREPIVKELKRMELLLIKSAADNEEEKMVVKAHPGNRRKSEDL